MQFVVKPLTTFTKIFNMYYQKRNVQKGEQDASCWRSSRHVSVSTRGRCRKYHVRGRCNHSEVEGLGEGEDVPDRGLLRAGTYFCRTPLITPLINSLAEVGEHV